METFWSVDSAAAQLGLNPALQVFSHLQEVPRGWLPSKLLQYCFARVLAACWLELYPPQSVLAKTVPLLSCAS